MKRWLTTLVLFAVCSAVVRADVTVVQTTTMEGGMVAMAGGNVPTPTMTTRMKGMRSRTEVATGGAFSVITITDLTAKQIIILRPDQKTATIASLAPPAIAGAPAAPPAPAAASGGLDASVKLTGKSQTIDGIKCDEYAFTTTLDMSALTGGQMPPEAAASMQGVKMIMAGSMWVAKDVPGAAEYVAYQKASASIDMSSAAAGVSGVKLPGMDKVMKAMGSIDGMAYLTEMTMNVEGTGQIADMMKQMGPMKLTIRTTSIKADALSDDLFKVPEGYTVVK
jgi:hypothetical protein